MKSIYVNKKVTNPDVTDNSPNKIGTVTECKRFFRQKCLYTIEFRDYTEWWGLSFMKNNLI
jgi:hypothetical protein